MKKGLIREGLTRGTVPRKSLIYRSFALPSNGIRASGSIHTPV